MKIFDMHIHSNCQKPDPKGLLEKMDNAGISGGCVFSERPINLFGKIGATFSERLENVLLWTKDNKNELFPIMWVHPDEPNIIKNVQIASERGVAGFKIICNNFYAGDKHSIKLISAIAELKKPVIFHSGILWDGAISSSYNRPISFESLIHIKGLRFALAHCSWPWYDECIALYGKFLNAYIENPDSAEMFFDITPGTPAIYREDLFTKLFTIGYDVPDNIMFGTDGNADNYSAAWSKEWIERDNAIYDKLGVKEDTRKKIYGENLLRFLGKKEKDFTHLSPTTDDANRWTVDTVR